MESTPRPYVRIDRVWFLDRKYRKVSHQAVLLHLGLIGLSSHEGNDGKVRREDADLIADNIRLNAQDAWDDLVGVELLVPAEGDWFHLPNYGRWQVLNAERSRAAAHGAAGGKKSAAKREMSPSSPSDDAFDLAAGLNEALSLYPFTKYQDSRHKQEQAYRGTVRDREDHERVMMAIRNYREYCEYRKKTDGPARSAELTSAFSNFLTSDKWQGFLVTKVPSDADLAAGPTLITGPDKPLKAKPETVKAGEKMEDYAYLLEETNS